jgi:hypothetical protein
VLCLGCPLGAMDYTIVYILSRFAICQLGNMSVCQGFLVPGVSGPGVSSSCSFWFSGVFVSQVPWVPCFSGW